MVVGLCRGVEVVSVRTLDLKKAVNEASLRELKMAEIRAALELPKGVRGIMIKTLGFFQTKQIRALRDGEIDSFRALSIEKLGAIRISKDDSSFGPPTLGNYVAGLKKMYLMQTRDVH